MTALAVRCETGGTPLTFDAAHGIADLPGLPLGHPDPEIPASHVVAQYYGDYEQKFELAVERPAKVIGVCNSEDNDNLLTVVWMKNGTCTSVTCDVVLNATGTWTHPYTRYCGLSGHAASHGEFHYCRRLRGQENAGRWGV